MKSELPTAYEPQRVESDIYRYWLERDLFSSRPDGKRKPFTIVIPPPNVTGSLHMGHALNNSLQDAIIRYKRLAGFNTLWIPGTDHGGIATQNVVEKILLSEGKTKNELGREKFLERMWQWRKATGDTILEQLKKLGCALDWSRTRFTMDEVCSRAVREAFVRLFNKGLIYRGKRLVNWCPRCMTAISDIEVEHNEEIGKLWHIKYPFSDGSGFVVVATTRPETMLGDTAVAVHPDDARYKNIIGKKIKLPLTAREIPVISDSAVDPSFGTGAVKVTPAHDPTDFEIGLRHNLERIVVIGFDAKMTEAAGRKYEGLDRYRARKEILEDLELQCLLLETADHPHSVGVCYRCGTTIEPLISEQWFLSVGKLSQRAIEASRAGAVRFYPSSWEKPYLLWLENLKDWCISRQIWWGHRIPVYYCKNKNSAGTDSCPAFASVEPPQKCPTCGGKEIEQDPDVLDTWFSSALWPFSTLGWPEDNPDLDYYYPTSVLVTGHEILYLWVARMVQAGLEFMDEVPFGDVYIHGIVRDKFGKKMSKSLGNVIDPLDIIKKYGADALRFAMIYSSTAGRDIQLSDDSFVGARNFANKIYNATRYILMNLEKNPSVLHDVVEISDIDKSIISLDEKYLESSDRWILSELEDSLIGPSVRYYDSYELDKVARVVYDFTWNKFCDWYIEFTKERLYGSSTYDEKSRAVAFRILVKVLTDILKVLHPLMPFITEHLWQKLNEVLSLPGKSIMETAYPQVGYFSDDKYKQSAADINLAIEIINAIRSVREDVKIQRLENIKVIIRADSSFIEDSIERNSIYIRKLARLNKIEKISAGDLLPRKCAYACVAKGVEIFIPLEGVVDIGKEKIRLESELDRLEKYRVSLEAKLSNENFRRKAPPLEVANTESKLVEVKDKIAKLRNNLKYIS